MRPATTRGAAVVDVVATSPIAGLGYTPLRCRAAVVPRVRLRRGVQ